MEGPQKISNLLEVDYGTNIASWKQNPKEAETEFGFDKIFREEDDNELITDTMTELITSLFTGQDSAYFVMSQSPEQKQGERMRFTESPTFAQYGSDAEPTFENSFLVKLL